MSKNDTSTIKERAEFISERGKIINNAAEIVAAADDILAEVARIEKGSTGEDGDSATK